MAREYIISVKTQIPELKEQCGFANKVRVAGTKTWSEFLSENVELPVDKHQHFIKSASGKAHARLDEKVGDFMKNFKQIRQQYIVYLVPRQKSRTYPQSQCGRKNPRKRSNPLLHNKKKLPKKINVPMPLPTSSNRNNNFIRTPVKTGRRFEEDDMDIPVTNFNNFSVGNLNNDQRNDDSNFDDDFDDAMSQDSQDCEEDVKAKILDKILKQLTNGHLNRMKKELAKLTEGRHLSVSRYIPFTLTVLQMIFKD